MSAMTDFEIIVVQKVRARWERNNMEQEKDNVPTYDSQQMDDDTMIINILSKAGPDPVPIPVTYPSNTNSSSNGANIPTSRWYGTFNVNLNNRWRKIIEKDINLDTIATKEDLNTNSGSSDNYQSV